MPTKPFRALDHEGDPEVRALLEDLDPPKDLAPPPGRHRDHEVSAAANALSEESKGQIIDLYLDALDQIRVLRAETKKLTAQVKKLEDTRDWGGS